MSKEGTFKIVICGGRHFNDYEYLKTSCREIIVQLNTDKPVEIVSGHCMGCDLLGEKFAEENGYKLTVFPAEWKKYGKSAGIKRNIQMIDYIGHTDSAVIGFVSNNTKGTRYTVERANENGIKTFEFEYTPLYENRNLQEDK
ncbi:MAG: DUF2493 domain-containing protein [Clostridia bacterium]|nr:DUF2493 domain-containing protein [Clostridia bacterium]